jgi:hypothetical protein
MTSELGDVNDGLRPRKPASCPVDPLFLAILAVTRRRSPCEPGGHHSIPVATIRARWPSFEPGSYHSSQAATIRARRPSFEPF